MAARGDECDGLESTTEFKKRMPDERAEEVRKKNFMGSSLDKQMGWQVISPGRGSNKGI